ncbi:MAG TPA: hypothetical protein VGI70_04300, partial [Polyangiales bacterium]
EWPLWTLSSAYLIAIAIALFSLADDPSWLKRPRWPGIAAAVGGGLLLIDLVFGARAGTHAGGDAGYHIARVRLISEIGLNSWDPLIADRRIDSVYHTNLYHALIAMSAQLTRSDPAWAWLEVWPFAKLLTVAGSYQLALAVFGRRWLAWLGATTSLICYATYSVLPFPNTLAPAALLPMGLAAGVEAISGEHSLRPAFWLGASALALAQVHDLNAAFLAIVIAPCLLVAICVRAITGQPGKRRLLAALIAVGASFPWLIVPALPHLHAIVAGAGSTRDSPAAVSGEMSPTRSSTPAAISGDLRELKKNHKADRLTRLDNGLYVMPIGQLLGPFDRNPLGLIALAFALLFWRRSEVRAFAALLALTGAWLTVPILCTFLLRSFGAAWAVVRLTSIFPIALSVLIPAAAFVRFDRLRRRDSFRRFTEFGAIAIAILYAQRIGRHPAPWSERDYWLAVTNDQVRETERAIRERVYFFTSVVPSGATVLANTRWDYNLPMHMRAHTLALADGRGWHGVANMIERRRETEEFFDKATSGERRFEILRKYGIHYIYMSRRSAFSTALSLGLERASVARATRQGALLRVRY